MSRTGTGFEVSTSGGSFFGKKNSSRLRNRDFQTGSSRVWLKSRRCNSGSGSIGFCCCSNSGICSRGVKTQNYAMQSKKLDASVIRKQVKKREKFRIIITHAGKTNWFYLPQDFPPSSIACRLPSTENCTRFWQTRNSTFCIPRPSACQGTRHSALPI